MMNILERREVNSKMYDLQSYEFQTSLFKMLENKNNELKKFVM